MRKRDPHKTRRARFWIKPYVQVTRTTGTAVTVTRNCCIAWRAELLRIISRKTWVESPLVVVVAAVFPEDYGCSWIWIPDWRGQLALRSPVGRNHNGALGWLFCDHSNLRVCRPGRQWTQYSAFALPMYFLQLESSCTRHWILGCQLDSGWSF